VIVADTAAWVAAIAAVATAAVASAAIVVVPRFRPTFGAYVDARRQGIRLDVVNKGRAAGLVSSVAVVDGKDIEIDARFAGLAKGKFAPAQLQPRASYFLTIEAVKKNGPFPDDARVKVVWGKAKKRTLVPESVGDRAFYGDESNWP
jgi:hypothetical protein